MSGNLKRFGIIKIRMKNFLYLLSLILLMFYALGSGHYWLIIGIAAFALVGAMVFRQRNKKEEQQAYYKIVDKGKSKSILALSLLVYLLISAYYLFRILEPELRPYFYILIISSIAAALISGTHTVKFLLNENGLLLYNTVWNYRKKKLAYDQILQIREDANYLIIDTSKYINHVKIKKNLVSEGFRTFLVSKIKK